MLGERQGRTLAVDWAGVRDLAVGDGGPIPLAARARGAGVAAGAFFLARPERSVRSRVLAGLAFSLAIACRPTTALFWIAAIAVSCSSKGRSASCGLVCRGGYAGRAALDRL